MVLDDNFALVPEVTQGKKACLNSPDDVAYNNTKGLIEDYFLDI